MLPRIFCPAHRVQSGGGFVQDQHLRLHGDDACNGHPELLSSGQGQRARPPAAPASGPRSLRPPGPAGQFRPASGPCSWGRRRCPYRRSPQKADIPGTGTPGPPGTGRRVTCLPPRYSARTAAPLSVGGLQKAVQVLDEGGFSGAGVADDTQNSPFSTENDTWSRAVCSKESHGSKYGSGPVTSIIGSNGTPVLHSVRIKTYQAFAALAMAAATFLHGEGIQAAHPVPARRSSQSVSVVSGTVQPYASAKPHLRKNTFFGVPSAMILPLVHDHHPVRLRPPHPCGG